MKDRCLVIPALKKHAVIPDQLVKKLQGQTLISRALDTARSVCPAQDIVVLTDSQEITLICERASVGVRLNPKLRFKSLDIVAEMRELLTELALAYRYVLIYRASCPLVTWVDIEQAYKEFIRTKADALITVKHVPQRVWNVKAGNLQQLLQDDSSSIVVESRALILLKLNLLEKWGQEPKHLKILPFFLDEHAVEIQGYQDWWICEHLLARRHVVFVVAGFPAIGMGHVFRALMLAHEITSHQISFVCTKESELAVENIACKDYPIVRQTQDDLASTVLKLRPDLVVNDFLNTPLDYMQALKQAKVKCINFEDEGDGSKIADLVINALYEDQPSTEQLRMGPSYFCLRDEFLEAKRNPLRSQVHTLLITFGGTDQYDCSRRVLDIVEPICRAFSIAIRLVVGPGYAHLKNMTKHIEELENPLLHFTYATNVMSRMMEGADLAICSAGRTVYELCHMRIPALVLAHHQREARHTFARPKHGFAFVGLMTKVSDQKIRNVFLAMLKQDRRARFWQRQNDLDFSPNKARVIKLMLKILESDSEDGA
ncbi:MAG: cytidine 5'-phosphate N-acetylneuraminic acid synthetase [Desulfovibrionaceae bacterium]|nr:cytidine 5'-phosphate N-acetylneuraminic acid synthetase [Desulfovibrionaceae bacterium]